MKRKELKNFFGKKYNRCVKKEDVTIEDADGNTFAEVIDLIEPEPIKGFKSQVDEATRIQAKTGNLMMVIAHVERKELFIKNVFPTSKTSK
jgi:hypothetical protein